MGLPQRVPAVSRKLKLRAQKLGVWVQLRAALLLVVFDRALTILLGFRWKFVTDPRFALRKSPNFSTVLDISGQGSAHGG
jgi:hypothetical protein